MVDRKPSPLATGGRAPWKDDDASSSSSSGSQDQQEHSQPVGRSRASMRMLPGKKAKRRNAKLGPFDRVGFNANLPVVVRRLARMLAARWECDVQDVAEIALLELFEREGITVPTTQDEYDEMVRSGAL